MKRFFSVSAIVEVGAGLGLLAAPSLITKLLLGSEISGVSISLGRVGGAGLLALGVACWLARGDAQSGAARGLAGGMLVYNLGAVIVLGAAGMGAQPVGVVLWPAVILHAGMAAWCIAGLRMPSSAP